MPVKKKKITLIQMRDTTAAYRNACIGMKKTTGAGHSDRASGAGLGVGTGITAGHSPGSGTGNGAGSGVGEKCGSHRVILRRGGSGGPGSRAGRGGLYVNSPVILGLTLVSALILIGDSLTGGLVNHILMSRFTSWIDPLMYMRFFTRVLAHADFAHYFANFMLILVVGPLMEEKYGAKRLMIMLMTTAFTTGLFNALLFPEIATIGASGLAFMLILLSSFVNVKNGGIPITMVLVSVFYIGNEVLSGLFVTDNISQFSHVAGGLCGAAYGFYFRGK